MLKLVRRCLGADAADEKLLAEAVSAFRRHYAVVNGEATTVYAGAIETLSVLRERGMRMACVTNKPAEFTAPLLAKTGLAGYFAAIVSGDTLAEKKPHPAPLVHACELLGCTVADAVMIGDSANDAAAARAAGMAVYLVTYGYSEGLAVDSIECDGLLSSLVDALPRLPGRASPDNSSS
jgi:phosphoglycolate phosphatase